MVDTLIKLISGKSILQELEEDLEDDSGGQESQREGINNDT